MIKGKSIIVLILIFLFLNTLSYAKEYATFKGIKKNKIEYYEIYIGNTLIFRLRDKGNYDTSLLRTMAVIEKLNEIFNKKKSVKLYDFGFDVKRNELFYKKERILKITQMDIKLNKTEPLALGLLWLNRLRIGILNERGYILGKKVWGIASWYGRRFHGKKTAYGEIYNRFELTAASLKYPYNTLLIVTNPQNKRRVIIRINDKGPYKKGRILDLSEGSAYILGMKKEGIKRLIIQTIKLAN